MDRTNSWGMNLKVATVWISYKNIHKICYVISVLESFTFGLSTLIQNIGAGMVFI